MYKFQVGTPDGGPFTRTLEAEDQEDAERYVTKNYGEIQDGMEWTDEFNNPVMLFIVLK